MDDIGLQLLCCRYLASTLQVKEKKNRRENEKRREEEEERRERCAMWVNSRSLCLNKCLYKEGREKKMVCDAWGWIQSKFKELTLEVIID